LNTCMNWDNILNNDALCESAAHDAAKLLDSTSFLATLDDDSLESTLEAPNENGYLERSEERASGGAEPPSKRARLDEVVFFDLDAAPLQANGTQDEPEKEYFELQPATSPATSHAIYEPPADVHDILYGLDCQPSTSTAVVQPEPQSEWQPEPDRTGEDEWVDFYYELEDPHPDIFDKVKAQMDKTDEEIAKTDAELCAALIEKATMDQMVESTKRKTVYKEPGKKDHVVYVCFVCSRGFLTTEEMRTHVQESHLKAGAERDFKCRFCRRSFAKRAKLQMHERKHTDPHANFACDKCPAFYTTKDTLERHYSDKHGCRMDGTMIANKKLECEHCGKVFGVKKELQYHLYYCSRKEEIAEQRAAKREKERAALPKDEPIVKGRPKLGASFADKSCPICGLVTSSMQSRNRHIQRKHPEKYLEVMAAATVYSPTAGHLAALPFSCSQCDGAYANRAALSIHERRAHGANPAKMYYCTKCSRG
ncbi:hypothetical protein PMAYCL1PPCAC_21168, partial [Pristionchus mayeri]